MTALDRDGAGELAAPRTDTDEPAEVGASAPSYPAEPLAGSIGVAVTAETGASEPDGAAERSATSVDVAFAAEAAAREPATASAEPAEPSRQAVLPPAGTSTDPADHPADFSPCAVLAVEDLYVTFRSRHGRAPARAVDGVHLAIAPGEIVALVGESGCGKTTLARALTGLCPAGWTRRGSRRGR